MISVLSSPVGRHQHRPDLFWFGLMFHLQGKSNILCISWIVVCELFLGDCLSRATIPTWSVSDFPPIATGAMGQPHQTKDLHRKVRKPSRFAKKRCRIAFFIFSASLAAFFAAVSPHSCNWESCQRGQLLDEGKRTQLGFIVYFISKDGWCDRQPGS